VTILLNNQKLCPQSEFHKILAEHCISPNNVNPTAYTSVPTVHTLLLQIKVITGIFLCNKQILLEVILLPFVNHSVKLQISKIFALCNVIKCLLLVTDVLGLTVHPETSVTNYQSMLPNIPEE
jgi:hypothetical protein